MADYAKCKECRWHIGEYSIIGTECMQPDNQERWAHQEKIREKKGAFYPKVVARYKQPSTKACKRFEPKPGQTDCQWK